MGMAVIPRSPLSSTHRAALTLVADMMNDAADALVHASGGSPLCRTSAFGREAPTVKHAEGQRAALKELQRALTANESSRSAAELSSALATTWHAEHARLLNCQAGHDWVAYRAGGVHALEHAAALLRPSPPPTPQSLP